MLTQTPAIVRTIDSHDAVSTAAIDSPRPKSRRRRGSGKGGGAVKSGLVAGVEYNTPSTRLVAIFLNALSKSERAYALDLLRNMANRQLKPVGAEGGVA